MKGEGARRQETAVATWHSIGTMALLAISLLAPILLIYSAVASRHSITEIRAVFLRSRIVSIADRLELLPSLAQGDLRREFGNDADVAEIRIFLQPVSEDPEEAALVRDLLEGKRLHASAEVGIRYRTYMLIRSSRFHSIPAVARIDIYPTAGDRLVRDASRLLAIAYGAAIASFATLAAYLILARRTARLKQLAQVGTMSAALAHEIRNPLGAIKGFVQLTKKKTGPDVAYYVDAALREIIRLEKLVEDLLAYARKSAPKFRPVAFESLVPRLAPSDTSPPAIEFAYPPGFVLRTDADLLVQILANLIRNAMEANEHGRVRVHVQPANGEVLIAVDDEGPGIPQQLRKRIFEPFFTTKASGTGLGLPIAQKLATELNGNLRLVRRYPQGTSARLTLLTGSGEELNGNDTGS